MAKSSSSPFVPEKYKIHCPNLWFWPGPSDWEEGEQSRSTEKTSKQNQRNASAVWR